MAIRVFGLTGGIGSGKSTVAQRFRDRGLPVIDADVLAREVVARGTPGLEEVVSSFGSEVLNAEGGLDRARVADIVFADAEARKKLDAIVHPRVAAAAAERATSLDAEGHPLACYEVPLLVEGGLVEMLRPVVVVVVEEAAQVERTVARDGCSEDAARARIAAQLPLADKARVADYVIDNGGAVQDTLERADEVLDAVCAYAGVDPRRYPRP